MNRFATILLATSFAATAFAGKLENPPKPGAEEPQGGLAGLPCTCTGDLDVNGNVGAADLSILLGAWGTNSVADLDGNGTVDGADLSILLGAWGPCVGLPNDDCANAFELAIGDNVLCTIGANDSDFGVSGCGLANTIHNDVWFYYVPQGNGTLTLSTCGQATFDTVIAAYTSIIPGLSVCPTSGIGLATLVGCNDDTEWCPSNSSYLEIDVTGGNVYKIRVGGYFASSEGTAVLTANFTSVGAHCYDGIPVYGDIDSTQYVTGTTVDNPYDPAEDCNSADSRSEWISYTAPCIETEVYLSTCFPETDFDTVIDVWEENLQGGCTAVHEGCQDDSPGVDCQINGFQRKSKFHWNAESGRIYHIRISGFNGSAAGNYKLEIYSDCIF